MGRSPNDVARQKLDQKNAVQDTEHNEIAISDGKYQFQTYYVGGITIEDRVVYQGTSCQIKSLSEIGRRRGIVIHAEVLALARRELNGAWSQAKNPSG